MRSEIWEAREAAIRPYLEDGMSNSDVAMRLGLNVQTVRTYRNRLAIPRRSNIHVGSVFDRREAAIRECAGEGLTRQETADKLGLSLATVGKYGRERAIAFRHASSIETDPRSEAMVAMYRAGKTLQQIGGLYGVTRERVRQLKDKALMRLRHNSKSNLLQSYLN